MEESTLLHWKWKTVIRECREQLHTNKLNGINEMDKFLEGHRILKLTRVKNRQPK